MLTLMHRFLRRLRRDTSGLSALEFAIILPVMLTSILGAVEVSNGMLADRKVTQVTSTIADLTSQDTELQTQELRDIWAAGAAIMYPMGAAPLKMRLSSVVADLNGVTSVEWSCGSNYPARAAGAPITVPPGMVQPGASVIFAEVEYRYTSSIGEFLTSGVTVKDKFYLRPRRTLKVVRAEACP